MAAVSVNYYEFSDSRGYSSEPYAKQLIDSAPYLGKRRVEVIAASTKSPIPADIVASRIGPLFVSYELVDSATREVYGYMDITLKEGACVYVGTLKNSRREEIKGVGTRLLDQAFLLGDAHSSLEGKPGIRLISAQGGGDPDPAPFYLKYGFLPSDDEYPKYPEISRITKDLDVLERDDWDLDQIPSVKRGKEILAKELGKETISNEELFDNWYWEGKPEPYVVLSEKILGLHREGRSMDLLIEMHLPDPAIETIRRRLLGV